MMKKCRNPHQCCLGNHHLQTLQISVLNKCQKLSVADQGPCCTCLTVNCLFVLPPCTVGGCLFGIVMLFINICFLDNFLEDLRLEVLLQQSIVDAPSHKINNCETIWNAKHFKFTTDLNVCLSPVATYTLCILNPERNWNLFIETVKTTLYMYSNKLKDVINERWEILDHRLLPLLIHNECIDINLFMLLHVVLLWWQRTVFYLQRMFANV